MILIPTYNERENVEGIWRAIREKAPEVPIMFVDDSSPDGTAEKIREIIARDSKVRLLIRTSDRGLGPAYRQAIKKIIDENLAEYIITMDADFSHPVSELPKLIELVNNYDVVVGSRYTTGGGVWGWARWRHYISKLGNVYAAFFINSKLKDLTAGFVAYSTDTLRRLDLSQIRTNGYAFQIEMKSRLETLGAKIYEHPITFIERWEGKSKFSRKIFFEGLRYPAKIFYQRERLAVWASTAVFIIPFIFYALTAPHTIFLEDNAEFITAAKTLGVTHPSGYPLYVLLAKIFSFLPLGNLAYRVNLFSAFAGSIGLLFFYWVCRQVVKKMSANARPLVVELFSFFATLLLAFSPVFWSQSIVAEVYTLNFAITLLIVYLALRFWETHSKGLFLAIAFLAGLGLANHQMLALSLSVILICLLRFPPRFKYWVYGTILFLAGFSANFLMILFSRRHPALDFGHVNNISHLIAHLLRKYYKDYGHQVNINDAKNYLADYFSLIWQQFKYILPLSVLGIFLGAKKNWRLTLLMFGLMASNSLGIILVRNIPYAQEAPEVYEVYYLLSYALVVLFFTVAVVWLFNALRERGGVGKIFSILLAMAIIFLTTFSGYRSYQANNLRDFTFVQDLSANFLRSIEPNSVVVLSFEGWTEDTLPFAFLYQRAVENVRPDVTFVGYPAIFPSEDEGDLDKGILKSKSIGQQRKFLLDFAQQKYQKSGRPIYANIPVPGAGFNGYVYNISGVKETAGATLSPSAKDIKILSATRSGRDVLAYYYYLQAARYLTQNNFNDSQMNYAKAIQNDEQPLGDDFIKYRDFRNYLLETQEQDIIKK